MSQAATTAPTSIKPTSGTAANISTRTGSPPPPTSGPLRSVEPIGEKSKSGPDVGGGGDPVLVLMLAAVPEVGLIEVGAVVAVCDMVA